MHKLLREEIRLYSRTDIVKSEEFSERMKRIMEEYRRSQISNAKSLDQLYQDEHGDRHGSSSQEETEHPYHTGGTGTAYTDGQYIQKLNQVIESLINIAKDIVESDKNGEKMGLTKEELSFYHALTFKETIEEFYEDGILIEMAKELTRELKESESIDWQYKESGRARMRSIVRRLLRRYKYPPEEMKEALDIVLKQCEHWSMRRIA